MTVRLFSFRKGAANLMDGYETEKLDALYARIEREGRDALLRGGSADAFLCHPEADTRMSVVLLFRPTDEITARVGGMLREFQTRFPALYSYPASDMHVTVLDLLRGRPGLQKPAGETFGAYIQSIRRALSACGSFRVCFRGVTVSDGALLVRGYSEEMLTYIRQALREGLCRDGLCPQERYETISCHITAIRFPVPLAEPRAFLKLAERYRHMAFGVCTVRELEWSFHDWYDTRKETLGRFPLPS